MAPETAISVFKDSMIHRGFVTATASAPWELAEEDILPLKYYHLKTPKYFGYPWETTSPKYVIEKGVTEQIEYDIYVKMSPVEKYIMRVRIKSIKEATPKIIL